MVWPDADAHDRNWWQQTNAGPEPCEKHRWHSTVYRLIVAVMNNGQVDGVAQT